MLKFQKTRLQRYQLIKMYYHYNIILKYYLDRIIYFKVVLLVIWAFHTMFLVTFICPFLIPPHTTNPYLGTYPGSYSCSLSLSLLVSLSLCLSVSLTICLCLSLSVCVCMCHSSLSQSIILSQPTESKIFYPNIPWYGACPPDGRSTRVQRLTEMLRFCWLELVQVLIVLS